MGIRNRISFYTKVNWLKTIYFNFKKFPFSVAKKLPVFFYGPVKFANISGKIVIDAPIRRGMIGFGQPYEMPTISAGLAELKLLGTIVFNGAFQTGKDCFFYIGAGAELNLGNMCGIGSSGIVICSKKITLGSFARIASETRISDTDFHPMIDTITNEVFEMEKPINIGSYNYITSRVKIMKGTITPDYCTVASNSLCNKDYSTLGSNILIGGMPAKLLKNNISRDWETEEPLLEQWMKLP